MEGQRDRALHQVAANILYMRAEARHISRVSMLTAELLQRDHSPCAILFSSPFAVQNIQNSTLK